VPAAAVTGEEHVSGIALIAVADTGSVTAAIAVANTSRTRVYKFRKAEPLVSAGKLVRDDDGQPILVRRYSDNLLLALLNAHRPPRREKSVRFQLPALRSAADAASAMAALTAGVGAGGSDAG
jgi:hypothetical protein